MTRLLLILLSLLAINSTCGVDVVAPNLQLIPQKVHQVTFPTNVGPLHWKVNADNESNDDLTINSEQETQTSKVKQVLSNKHKLIRLTEDNFVVLRGEINGVTTSNFITELMSKNEKTLYVYLSTQGGSVVDGMQIVQTLQAMTDAGTRIHCIADTAMSMGFVIFQYCPNRYVMQSSVIMQHQMSLGVEGSINNINTYMHFINSMDEEIESHQASRVGLSLTEFRAKVAHDWWLTGSSAVAANAADKLVRVLCNFKHDTIDQQVPTIFGDITVVYSNCPLARDPLAIKFPSDMMPEDKLQLEDQIKLSRKTISLK